MVRTVWTGRYLIKLFQARMLYLMRMHKIFSLQITQRYHLIVIKFLAIHINLLQCLIQRIQIFLRHLGNRTKSNRSYITRNIVKCIMKIFSKWIFYLRYKWFMNWFLLVYNWIKICFFTIFAFCAIVWFVCLPLLFLGIADSHFIILLYFIIFYLFAYKLSCIFLFQHWPPLCSLVLFSGGSHHWYVFLKSFSVRAGERRTDNLVTCWYSL